MSSPKKAVLNEDVYSNFNISDKHRKPYGKSGEEVIIISESESVLIVENKKGDRFTVNIERVTIKN